MCASSDPGPGGRLSASELTDRLARALREPSGAPSFGAEPTIAYLTNWGGFVNGCFRVRGDGRDAFVKLAWEAQAIAALRRWERFAPTLHERHAAPRMVGWLRLGGTAYEGPVLDWVEGEVPRRDERLVGGVAAALARLHADADLAARLRETDAPRTCRDVYFAGIGERFVEDLRFLDGEALPVALADLEETRREVLDLASRVAGDRAFDEEASAPIHGDLWLENLVRARSGGLVVLDWDGLALGDPVVDWATFLGPTRADPRPASLDDVPGSSRWSDASRSRFHLYARAGLLDGVVDGLADWVDARVLGERAGEIRAEKERAVRAMLAAYRETFLGR
jgi:aminoglycoside phosphotransferase (APT) family kinase protein